MIYLFEDREDRKQQFLGDNINHPLICQNSFDCSNVDEIANYIKNNYHDAKVVLLHKSYDLGKKEFTIENIKNGFKTVLGIPVVLFSGGSNSSIIKEGDIVTAEINSGVMYQNLNFFAEIYQKDGVICIPILVYGKYYRINQLLEIQAKMNDFLFDRHVNDTIQQSDIRKLNKILNDIAESSISEGIGILKSWIEKNRETLKIERLQKAVQQLIKKYRV